MLFIKVTKILYTYLKKLKIKHNRIFLQIKDNRHAKSKIYMKKSIIFLGNR